jgi:glycosyltransferase involved in cell wall biosynthesis
VSQVDIIIPTYNRAHLIRRAIESVRAQTYQEWRLWIIDDASQDATEAVVAEYQDPRIRYCRHEMNQGAAAARNTGMRQGTSPFIAFLDSDDEWLPDKLSRQLEVMQQNSSGISVTAFEWHVDGKVNTHVPMIARFLDAISQGCDLSPGSTLMIKREVINDIGLMDTTLQRFEDWDWLLRYAVAGGKCATVPEICARIYTNRGAASRSTLAAVPIFSKRHAQTLGNLGASGRRGLGQLWLQGAGEARRLRQWGTMLRYLWHAYKYCPQVVMQYLRNYVCSLRS